MTNPNNGKTVTLTVPELLDGTNPYAADISTVDESTDPAELLSMARKLSGALDKSSAYGLTLWQQLSAVATYLREDVAQSGDPGAEVPSGDEARRRWEQVYSSVLSALAGPRGDSGYGQEQAQLEMQNHRLPTR